MGILTKNNIVNIKEINKHVKNKFSFKWLERTVKISDGTKVIDGNDFVKTDVAGQNECRYIDQIVKICRLLQWQFYFFFSLLQTQLRSLFF